MDLYPGTWVRYHRHIQQVLHSASLVVNQGPARVRETRVAVIFGPSGTGKSHHALSPFINADGELDETRVYIKGDSSKWWEDYKGQEVVVWDEFLPDKYYCIAKNILRITDKWPTRVFFKGGSAKFRSKTIIFTSNSDYRHWFNDHASPEAFQRRVTLGVQLTAGRVEILKGNMAEWTDLWPEGISVNPEMAQQEVEQAWDYLMGQPFGVEHR